MSIYNVIPPLPSSSNSSKLLSLTDSLVFASIISAVDPVPVLGILHEAGVNKQLYFLIFGESLLNGQYQNIYLIGNKTTYLTFWNADAVTVSLYSSTVAFTGPVQVKESHYGMAALAFLVKSFGGLLIGVFFGLLSALTTRTTQHHRSQLNINELWHFLELRIWRMRRDTMRTTRMRSRLHIWFQISS